MAEITNEPIYEVLCSVQERVARQDDKLGNIHGEITTMRGCLYAVNKDVANIHAMLAQHDVALDASSFASSFASPN